MVFFSDPSLQSQDLFKGINLALFQTMSAHTTVGFNSYDYGSLSSASLMIIMILMFIGASPSGTGGGIKTTSIVALYAVTRFVINKREEVTFLSQKIPKDRVYFAVASFSFYFVILFIGFWAILLLENEHFTFDKLLFECISALSTVGISTGITGDLGVPSKLIICVLMFIGRIGAITFGLSLVRNFHLEPHQFIPEEDIAI